MIPTNELPDKAELQLNESSATTYARQQSQMMNDAEIQQALNINSHIDGFCSLPESILHLPVDAALEHTIFRRQYAIPQAVKSLVDEIIDRWHDTGRIELAPVGCRFNSSLTVAPKRDDTGKVTGVRVCLDTRTLNKALISQDRFPIPYIRTALEAFAGA